MSPGVLRRGSVFGYAAIVSVVALSVWLSFPYATFTATYLASCAVLLLYDRKQPALQVTTAVRANRSWVVSVVVSLVNTVILDA